MIWLGRVEDVREVWAEAAIAVLPSTYGEGLPKSLLEAASCGRAIVASDMPGCREIVRPGQGGRDRAAGPAGRCRGAGRGDRSAGARPGTAARDGPGRRRLVEREFAEERIAAQTLALYETVCTSGAQRGDKAVAGGCRAGRSRLGDGRRARGASRADPRAAELLRTGALYGMVHAAALVAVIALAQGREPRRGAGAVAGWSFAVGIVLFSGSLFGLAAGAGRWLGWVAPFGGGALMLGWAALAVLALRRR